VAAVASVAPFRAGLAPVHANPAPVCAGLAPVHANPAPVCAGLAPAHISPAPVRAGLAPALASVAAVPAGHHRYRSRYAGSVPAAHQSTWVACQADPLPTDAAVAWATVPSCGAVVTFMGTVRDHAEGRAGVQHLTYEAYEGQVEHCFSAIADEARQRWPTVERIALLHRTGRLALTETSVTVVVAAAHRGEAFEAARFCIDAIKERAPIWKHEVWADGQDWGLGAHSLLAPADASSGSGAAEPSRQVTS
jgi:molybdopterin synthase catalytic subunit